MSINGRDFWLLEPLYYTTQDGRLLRVREGSSSDGGSVPRITENLIERFGKLLFAYVLHDGGYRDRLDIYRDGVWQPVTYNQRQCDGLLLESAESLRVNAVERDLIYTALRALGARDFNEDRISRAAS